MHPNPYKLNSVQEWPTPTSATTLQQFLGLASYYQRYIETLADIAAPLYNLTKANVSFPLTPECIAAFTELKNRLTQAYHRCCPVCITNRCQSCWAGGHPRVGGHVIAYQLCFNTIGEAMQRYTKGMPFVAVYAMKQFCHYLLGCSFQLVTDHAPMEWLSAQKMEGLLLLPGLGYGRIKL